MKKRQASKVWLEQLDPDAHARYKKSTIVSAQRKLLSRFTPGTDPYNEARDLFFQPPYEFDLLIELRANPRAL